MTREESVQLLADVPRETPTYEQLHAAAVLVAADGQASFATPDCEGGALVLVVNVNDLFGPAADAEDVPWDEVLPLRDSIARDGWTVVARWVAARRGIPPVTWRGRAL